MGISKSLSFVPNRPLFVIVAAFVFLLAPITNLIFPLYTEGVSNWYRPEAWWMLLKNFTVQELFVWSLLPISGALLLLQTRTSWFFAVVALVAISLHNFSYLLFDQNIASPVSPTFQILLNLTIVGILFYFRYPYLDQRDHLFTGQDKRIEVILPAVVDNESCTIKNLSSGGCLLVMDRSKFNKNIGDQVQLKFAGKEMNCRVMHISRHGVGLKFTGINKLSFVRIKKTNSAA